MITLNKTSTRKLGGQENSEVVCRSPTSGELFATVVNLTENSVQEVNLEGRTCENSAFVGEEVKEISGQQGEETAEEAAMEEYRLIYEDELEEPREGLGRLRKYKRLKRKTAVGEKDLKRNRNVNRLSQ